MYSTAFVTRYTGYSRQYLHQLRKGIKKRDIPAILQEGKHWKWEDGNVMFTEEGFKIIVERANHET